MEIKQEDLLTNYRNIEWLKKKLTVVWSSSKFCGLCLDNSENLNSVNLEFMISKQKDLKSMIDVLNYVFKDDVENILSSVYICNLCIEKTIQSYLFLYNTKKMTKIINKCVTDVYSKVQFINKENPMLILENDIELCKAVDDLITIAEVVPSGEQTVMKHIALESDTPVVEKKDYNVFMTAKIKNEIDFNLSDCNLRIPDSTLNISSEKGKIVLQPIKCLMDNTLEPKYTKFECKQCPDIFMTYRSLEAHEKAKHGARIYFCDLCDFICFQYHHLNQHYKNMHSVVHCRYCEMKINDRDLISHFKQNHADLIYRCNHCELVYHSQKSLNVHLRNVCKEEEQVLCVCLKRIMNEMERRNHKCEVTCCDCLTTPCIHFEYLVNFRDQILNNASTAKCLKCNYETDKKGCLLTHVNIMHLNHHPFECDHCGLQFYSKMRMKNHIIHFHMNNNVCEYCDVEFEDKKTLSEHMKSCKAFVRQHKCTKCAASFNTRVEYTKHEYLRHNGGGFPCKLCDRRFLIKKYLKNHKLNAHKSKQIKKLKKKIECTLCDITFENIKEMAQHKELHGPNTIYP